MRQHFIRWRTLNTVRQFKGHLAKPLVAFILSSFLVIALVVHSYVDLIGDGRKSLKVYGMMNSSKKWEENVVDGVVTEETQVRQSTMHNAMSNPLNATHSLKQEVTRLHQLPVSVSNCLRIPWI
jgi:hypothetical protein